MSTESHDTHEAAGHEAHDHGHGEPVRAEPDFVPVAPVIVGIAVIVVIFLVGIFWSYRIQRHQEHAVDGIAEDIAPKPSHAFNYEVGMINQKQFEQEHRAYDLQGQQKADLSGYGWTDKEKKLVHVPVEEGAKKLIQEQGAQQQQQQQGGNK
jgi:hypothetical protein